MKGALRRDPFTGTVYVFRSRRADRLKLVFWDGTGLVMIYKRLEDQGFVWPAICDGVMSLSHAQFEALFAGLDWRRVWALSARCPAETVSSQEVRALLASRRSLKNVLINIELSLRGLLRNFGLKLGAVSKGRWEERIRELIAGNAMLEAAAEPILRARAGLRRELAGLKKPVRKLASQDPVYRLLMTMPGVGPLVALTFKSAIDDPGRFRRSKDVGPWAGLTPRRNQSGERDIVGAITKAGVHSVAPLRCIGRLVPFEQIEPITTITPKGAYKIPLPSRSSAAC